MLPTFALWPPSAPLRAPELSLPSPSCGQSQTAAAGSPAWHRKQRRQRVAARRRLAAAFHPGSPRSAQAVERIVAHHGSALPRRIRASVAEMMWTCSCVAHHWTAQTVCPRFGRMAAGRPRRGVPNNGPSVQVPRVAQLQHQVPQTVPQIPQAPWFCPICETNNDQTNDSCMRCKYGYDKCRLAGQESRRWMLKNFPPQWTCACGRQYMPAHQICTSCTAAKPDTVLPSMCQHTGGSSTPHNAHPQQHVMNERVANQLPRRTPAGAPPREVMIFPVAPLGSYTTVGSAIAQGSAEGMHHSRSDHRLREAQTILADELRQVIGCDTQMQGLAKQRA